MKPFIPDDKFNIVGLEACWKCALDSLGRVDEAYFCELASKTFLLFYQYHLSDTVPKELLRLLLIMSRYATEEICDPYSVEDITRTVTKELVAQLTEGFKKIISAQSIFELIKSVLKIAFISYLTYTTIKDKVGLIYSLYDISLSTALVVIGDTVIALGIKIGAWYLIIAAIDFIYQKFKFKKDMRMSKQEVKDEYKNSEGDPQIKSQIKQRMCQASQRRMMQNIPKADVVITNPTHYAVAIQYDTTVADAPVEEVPAAPKKPLSKKTKTIIGIAAGAVWSLLKLPFPVLLTKSTTLSSVGTLSALAMYGM